MLLGRPQQCLPAGWRYGGKPQRSGVGGFFHGTWFTWSQLSKPSPVVASQPVSGREVTSLLVKSCPHFIEGKTEVWKGAGTGRGSSGQQPGLEPIPSCRPPVSTEPAQEAV